MDSVVIDESVVLGMCNLCLGEGPVKSMLIDYHKDGIKESYVDMLIKCFAIDLASIELGDTKKLICELCVHKLLEAIDFRKQVVSSLKTLEATVRLGVVKKEEALLDNGDDILDNDFPPDDLPEAGNIFSELDVKEETLTQEVKKDRRSSRKRCQNTTAKSSRIVKYSIKKSTDLTETENMLNSGLFPFKIRQNNIFSCAVCPEKSDNLDEIKAHSLQHHKKMLHVAFRKMMFYNTQRFYKCSDKLRCKICTADISNFEELKRHIESCTRFKFGKMNRWNNLPFKLEKDQLDCPVCKATFINFVSLNTHMNIHYPNYICENCGKAFASKNRLRGHIRTHEVGEFPCRYCDAVFDKVTKRENHVSREHKSGVRYACKRCNISLTSFYARQKHLAEVHNEELKRYKCKACTQSYITPGHLSSHVRRDHLNERNHKCDKCDQAFYTKNALTMHMIKHDGERIHTCPVCQKAYQRKKTLREHLRIHNNDKRFVCPVCGRAFTQKCTLKGHLKVHERKLDDDRITSAI